MRALIFDLDGTLVDTVYAHVFAWQKALAEAGMEIPGWLIHRRIGMSGGLFARAVARELGRALSPEEEQALQRRHGELFLQLLPDRRPLPGAADLLRLLREAGIAFGIATSGRRPQIDASLAALGLGAQTVVVARGEVPRAKPEPDLFLACQQRLGVRSERLLRGGRCGLGSPGRAARRHVEYRLAERRVRRRRVDPGRGVPGVSRPCRVASVAG